MIIIVYLIAREIKTLDNFYPVCKYDFTYFFFMLKYNVKLIIKPKILLKKLYFYIKNLKFGQKNGEKIFLCSYAEGIKIIQMTTDSI